MIPALHAPSTAARTRSAAAVRGATSTASVPRPTVIPSRAQHHVRPRSPRACAPPSTAAVVQTPAGRTPVPARTATGSSPTLVVLARRTGLRTRHGSEPFPRARPSTTSVTTWPSHAVSVLAVSARTARAATLPISCRGRSARTPCAAMASQPGTPGEAGANGTMYRSSTSLSGAAAPCAWTRKPHDSALPELRSKSRASAAARVWRRSPCRTTAPATVAGSVLASTCESVRPRRPRPVPSAGSPSRARTYADTYARNTGNAAIVVAWDEPVGPD